MSKRNAALEALSRPTPATSATVVELKPEAAPKLASAEAEVTGTPEAKAAAKSGTTMKVADYPRTMLYLPPKAKRKFVEIAFHSDRKEHDVYLEALRDYLEKQGHKGLL
jgi:hypothetical protein